MDKLKDFNYNRYLAGDKVIYEDGTPFEGEIFYSKLRKKMNIHEGTMWEELVVISKTGTSNFYYIDGYWCHGKTPHEKNLKMASQKTKSKWYLGILYPLNKEDEIHTKLLTSNLYRDKDSLEKSIPKDRKIIEIELEE